MLLMTLGFAGVSERPADHWLKRVGRAKRGAMQRHADHALLHHSKKKTIPLLQAYFLKKTLLLLSFEGMYVAACGHDDGVSLVGQWLQMGSKVHKNVSEQDFLAQWSKKIALECFRKWCSSIAPGRATPTAPKKHSKANFILSCREPIPRLL